MIRNLISLNIMGLLFFQQYDPPCDGESFPCDAIMCFFHRNNGILYHICMFFLNRKSSKFPIFKRLGFQATIKIFIGFHDAEKR